MKELTALHQTLRHRRSRRGADGALLGRAVLQSMKTAASTRPSGTSGAGGGGRCMRPRPSPRLHPDDDDERSIIASVAPPEPWSHHQSIALASSRIARSLTASRHRTRLPAAGPHGRHMRSGCACDVLCPPPWPHLIIAGLSHPTLRRRCAFFGVAHAAAAHHPTRWKTFAQRLLHLCGMSSITYLSGRQHRSLCFHIGDVWGGGTRVMRGVGGNSA